MTPIGHFGVGLRVVDLRALVAIRVVTTVKAVVAIGLVVAVRAIKGEKDRRTGADVGRSARRYPLRKKVPSGTPVTLRWLTFLGVMKRHIVPSEVQTKLSVQVVLFPGSLCIGGFRVPSGCFG